MTPFNYWQLLAGISAFLFAMTQLEGSIKSLSGRAFKKFLQKQTANKYRALLSGTVITAILQSSSVVVLMTLSFVGAGIIPLRNALAVVLGSNLGTTFNSWIIAYVGFQLELNTFAYPVMAVCLLGFIVFPKNKNIRSFSVLFFSMALMFIGLQWMKDSSAGLREQMNLEQFLSYSPYWFVLIGFVVTVILQSSAPTFALSLTGIQSGLFTLPIAAYMVIGAELGTTVKIVIGSLAGNADQKRLAAANFSFNLVTILLATFLVIPLLYFIQNILHLTNPFLALASFQSILNLLCIIIFFPWVGQIGSWMEKRFSERKLQEELYFINSAMKSDRPEDALSSAEKEIMHLLRHCLEFNRLVIVGNASNEINLSRFKLFWNQLVHPVSRTEAYNRLKSLQAEILDYLVELTKEELSAEESERCGRLITASRYMLASSKYLKDIQHNLDELHASANDFLFKMFDTIRQDEKKYLAELQQLFAENTNEQSQLNIEKWLKQNKDRQVLANNEVYLLLQKNSITQFNASTMLNVHRAIYYSHSTILNAVLELKMNPKD